MLRVMRTVYVTALNLMRMFAAGGIGAGTKQIRIRYQAETETVAGSKKATVSLLQKTLAQPTHSTLVRSMTSLASVL